MAVRESITEPAAKAAAGTLSDHPATTVMPRSLGAWPNLSMGVATNVIVMEVRFGSTQGRWPGEPILSSLVWGQSAPTLSRFSGAERIRSRVDPPPRRFTDHSFP
jgi:hypothetical protein